MEQLLAAHNVNEVIKDALIAYTPDIALFVATFRLHSRSPLIPLPCVHVLFADRSERTLLKWVLTEIVPQESVADVTESNYEFSPLIGAVILAWEAAHKLKDQEEDEAKQVTREAVEAQLDKADVERLVAARLAKTKEATGKKSCSRDEMTQLAENFVLACPGEARLDASLSK